MKIRYIRWAIWSLLLLVATFALISLLWPRSHNVGDPLAGSEIPAIESRPIIRTPRPEATIEGVRVINFWGSWCPPCRVEHASLMELSEEGYWIDGIAVRDTPEHVGEFLAELGDPFTRLYVDPEQIDYRAWKVRGVPETLVLTDEGEIVFRWTGPITEDVLERNLRPVLERYQD